MSDAPGSDEAMLRRVVRLDRYAEILAHVLHFGAGSTAEVVARFGLSLEHWWAIDRAWTNGLALGVRQEPREAVLRFSATFHAIRLRLARQKPALAAIGSAPQEAASPRAPELTLDQRVSLHVELELQPERKLQILQRYGLTPEQHERARAGWEARLALDPRLRAEWDNAVVQYRTWFVRNLWR